MFITPLSQARKKLRRRDDLPTAPLNGLNQNRSDFVRAYMPDLISSKWKSHRDIRQLISKGTVKLLKVRAQKAPIAQSMVGVGKSDHLSFSTRKPRGLQRRFHGFKS